jgi:hypothetical protein
MQGMNETVRRKKMVGPNVAIFRNDTTMTLFFLSFFTIFYDGHWDERDGT